MGRHLANVFTLLSGERQRHVVLLGCVVHLGTCARKAIRLPPRNPVLFSPRLFQRSNMNSSFSFGPREFPRPLAHVGVVRTMSTPGCMIVTRTQTGASAPLMAWLIHDSLALLSSFSSEPIWIEITGSPPSRTSGRRLSDTPGTAPGRRQQGPRGSTGHSWSALSFAADTGMRLPQAGMLQPRHRGRWNSARNYSRAICSVRSGGDMRNTRQSRPRHCCCTTPGIPRYGL